MPGTKPLSSDNSQWIYWLRRGTRALSLTTTQWRGVHVKKMGKNTKAPTETWNPDVEPIVSHKKIEESRYFQVMKLQQTLAIRAG